MISTAPQAEVPFRLKRLRPFSLLVDFKKKDDSPLNLTGCTVRMVISQLKRKGDVDLVTSVAALTSPTLGFAQFNIQGDDLNMVAGQYAMECTLISAQGYATTIFQGDVEVEHNADAAVPVDHTAVVAPLALSVTLRDQNRVTVRVNHSPDALLYSVVQQALDANSAAQIAAASASASAAAADGSAATASALQAAASAATAAALAAQAAADAAAALAAVGGDNAATQYLLAQAAATAAAASAAQAQTDRANALAAQAAANLSAAQAASSAAAAAASAAAAAGGGAGTPAGDAAAAAAAAQTAANHAEAEAHTALTNAANAQSTANAAQTAANTAATNAASALTAANAAQTSANATQAELDQTQADMSTTIQNFGKNMFVNQNEHTDAVHVHSIRVRTQAQYDAIGGANTISDCLYVIRG